MNQTRGYNFGAGPAALPESILLEAQNELLNWNGMDMSILEIGHRTPQFSELLEETTDMFRSILQIPENYHVLFLGGAARTQFATVPFNLMLPEQPAGYLVTGVWSQLAFQEAVKIAQAYCVTSAAESHFTQVPDRQFWDIREDSSYIFYTPNETVNGVRIGIPPESGPIPIVADMTSSILSEPIDVSQYGLIFAGAQKNIANAGLTIVIIRDDLLNRERNHPIPTMMDYRIFAETASMYATPPVFNCYLAHKMCRWVIEQGGIESLYRINCEKSQYLYDYIDNSDFYVCKVDPACRSLVNVCFTIADEQQRAKLELLFCEEAKTRGLYALKGHKTVGGLRASLYNSMPLEGVHALVDFMKDFARAMVL